MAISREQMLHELLPGRNAQLGLEQEKNDEDDPVSAENE